MTPKDQALKRKVTYVEYYRCGCSFAAAFKRDLLGYCQIHGEDRLQIHKIEHGTMELGHSK